MEAAGLKRCAKCQIGKPHSEFNRQAKNYDGLNTYCKDCRSKMKRAAYLADLDQQRLKARARAFGISVEQLQGLIAEQGDVCAICAKPCSTGRALALDHDHETGQFRGLLCAHCNMAIGQLQDSVEILRSALAYLMEWKGYATANEGVFDAGVS